MERKGFGEKRFWREKVLERKDLERKGFGEERFWRGKVLERKGFGEERFSGSAWHVFWRPSKSASSSRAASSQRRCALRNK